MSQMPPGPPTAPMPGQPDPLGGSPLGQQSGMGPPAPGRNPLLPWVITLAVVLVVVLVGGGALLLSDDDGGAGPGTSEPGTSGPGTSEPSGGERDTDSPEAATDAFLAAAAQGDCNTMIELVTDNLLGDSSREEALEECESAGDDQLLGDLERRGSAEVDGDRATAEAVDAEGDSSVMFELVQTDDGWKVDGMDIPDLEPPDLEPPDLDIPDVELPDVEEDEGSTSAGGAVEEAEQVVAEFLDAAYGEDCEIMIGLVTDSLLEREDITTRNDALATCESGGHTVEPYDALVVVGSELIDSGTALVVAEHTTRGLEGATVDFTVVQPDGSWWIDEITDNW